MIEHFVGTKLANNVHCTHMIKKNISTVIISSSKAINKFCNYNLKIFNSEMLMSGAILLLKINLSRYTGKPITLKIHRSVRKNTVFT